MPIEFACDCGKQFKVADEYAGKRSKCTACGKMVTVPTPPKRPGSVQETAEDAALRALTEGDDPSPAAPRMPGAFTGERPGAAPAAPAAAAPPTQDDAGSAASRALASQSALDKASRSKLRGKGKGKGKEKEKAGAQPSKGGIGIRFTVSWVRLGIGAFIVAAGLLWLVLGLASLLGVIGKRFEVIWPSLFMAAGVVVAASGFIHLYDKKDPSADED